MNQKKTVILYDILCSSKQLCDVGSRLRANGNGIYNYI